MTAAARGCTAGFTGRCGRPRTWTACWRPPGTRRYPLTRLRRMLLVAYLELPEPEHIPYLRLLAASSRGCTLLRQMRGAPVLTKPADVSRLGQTT